MYKTMIIDDDIPMLKYLKKLIQQNDFELQVCASTHSPLKALHFFQTMLPDIVLTDIGLPQMDGLTLAEKFKEIKPDVRVLFLTCHEDFHFAKRALTLNADDYLIKDELTPEQLEKSLSKAIQHLKNSPEHLADHHTILKNKDILKQQFISEIFDHRPIDLNYSKQLGIHMEQPDFLIGMSFIDFSSLPKKYTLGDIPLLQYAIINIAENLVTGEPGLTPLMDKQNNIFYLFNFKDSISRNMFIKFKQFFTDLQKHVEAYLQVQLSFVYMDQLIQIDQLGTMIEALYKLRHFSFYESGTIQSVRPTQQLNWHFNSHDILSSYEASLLETFDSKDEEELKKAIQIIAEMAERKSLNPIDLKENISRWVKLMTIKSGVLTEDDDFFHFLNKSVKLNETITLLKKKSLYLLETSEGYLYEQNKNSKLQEIDQLIIMHLSEHITSVDMARFLSLNPSYFSRYFKKNAGENFTDYVHRFKMRTAEKILLEDHYSIEWIAKKLGYSDRAYFSKIFKKHTGYSPGEYKMQNEQRYKRPFSDVQTLVKG